MNTEPDAIDGKRKTGRKRKERGQEDMFQ